MEEHPEARSIVNTLSKEGFIAYYAGGFVRDLLLGHPSDDIDIATNAPPETIQALFPHTVPIGIAFGIILVIVGKRQYEVATFRQDLDYKDGRRPSQIAFSSPQEDAKRRDFTINGMFYDPIEKKVLDYVGGKEDLKQKVVRAIGNPHERIKEDRLRMMRAVRLACRFGFAIDLETEKAILSHAKELFPAVAIERIMQEFAKAHAFGSLYQMLLSLHRLYLLTPIFPGIEDVSLKELEKRIQSISKYPKKAPLIASLIPLFPHYDLEDTLALCKKLKLPNVDLDFVRSFFLFKTLCESKRSIELYEWARAYADPFSNINQQILFCENWEALNTHKKQVSKLEHYVRRIIEKNPVIVASDLAKEGILPGKQMGLLLKEAERISVNEQTEEKQTVLSILKKSSLWSES